MLGVGYTANKFINTVKFSQTVAYITLRHFTKQLHYIYRQYNMIN